MKECKAYADVVTGVVSTPLGAGIDASIVYCAGCKGCLVDTLRGEVVHGANTGVMCVEKDMSLGEVMERENIVFAKRLSHPALLARFSKKKK